MFRSPEYNAWLDECELMIRRLKLPKITGHYKIMVRALRPDKRRRDIDNIGSKAIQDLLQRAGVIEDDCLCDAVYCKWVTSGPPIRINIYPVSGENHVVCRTTEGALQGNARAHENERGLQASPSDALAAAYAAAKGRTRIGFGKPKRSSR